MSRARWTEIALGILVPLLVWGFGILLVWRWQGDLPARVAVHWDVDGEVDATRSASSTMLRAGVGPAASALIVGGGVLRGWTRQPGWRLLIGTVVGISTLGVGVAVGVIAPQRGLESAALAPVPDLTLAGAACAAVLVGAAVARLSPGRPPGAAGTDELPPVSAPRLPLHAGERVVWARLATPGLGLLASAAALFLSVGYLNGVTRAPALAVLIAVGVLGIGGCLGCLRVWVDQGGLTVQGPLGRPRWHVPLGDIAEARHVIVRPVRDFWGWGYRVGDHRRALVLRFGEALEITEGDGSRLCITVRGAEQAAALLNSFADRERASS